jgi:hypothetical protein
VVDPGNDIPAVGEVLKDIAVLEEPEPTPRSATAIRGAPGSTLAAA